MQIYKTFSYPSCKKCFFAISNNFTIWVGAIHEKNENFNNLLEKVTDVIDDTMEGIDINIKPVIIDALDNKTDDNVINFKTLEDFKEFMQNTNIEPMENELADLFTETMNTFINFIK